MVNRLNTIMALAVVFLMVLATNRIDQHHFETAQKTVNEVYKDRVMVQGYIYSIAEALHQKELNHLQEQNAAVQKWNTSINEYIASFEATKLTRSEAELLGRFKKEFKELEKMEAKAIDHQNPKMHRDQIVQLKGYLKELSKIQITESRNLTKSAQKSLNVSALMANFEIFFLICIGVALQVLVFYKTKKNAKAS